jgi:hypothetical protein
MSMLVGFYVPVLHMLWFDELLRPGDPAVDKDDRPMRNLVGAQKLTSRFIENRFIFKVEGKGASVDLWERIGVHKLEERGAGIGTKYMDLVACALIEPSLKDQAGADPRRLIFRIQASEEQDGAP